MYLLVLLPLISSCEQLGRDIVFTLYILLPSAMVDNSGSDTLMYFY